MKESLKQRARTAAIAILMLLFLYSGSALTVNAVEIGNEVVSVETAYSFTLLLKSDGTVWAAGDNVKGQLGDGTVDSAASFQQIPGLENIIAIDVGSRFAIALKSDGTVWAWGDNFYGQLGTGDTTERQIPTMLTGISDVRAIAAGQEYSLAVKEDGTVWAWGYGGYGQLGLGHNSNRYVPTQVPGLSQIVSVSASNSHSLAVSSEGTVWAWGKNGYGQLGNGLTEDINSPVLVTGLNDVKMAKTGITGTSYAVTNNGTVYAWGRNSTDGELGLGDTNHRSVPTQVAGISQITSIAPGSNHVLALTESGEVYAFGGNSSGQLGVGSTVRSRIPIKVEALTGVTYITAGQSRSLAVDQSGQVWSWGSSGSGALGNGEISGKELLPMQSIWAGKIEGEVTDAESNKVAGARVILHTNIASKQTTTDEEGRYIFQNVNPLEPNLHVTADGYISEGEYNIPLESGGTEIVNLTLSAYEGVAAGQWLDIKSNNEHMIALKNDGTVWTKGNNAFGQLGDGTTVSRNMWMKVPNLTNITEVDLGVSYSIALSADGTVWSWGINDYGQLGHGDQATRFIPEKIELPITFTAIASGNQHVLALDTAGGVWAWGANNSGQLGSGTNEEQYFPVNIAGLPDVDVIRAGGDFSAVVSEGEVFTWGDNNRGQLGQGHTQSSTTPVKVEGMSHVQLIDVSDEKVLVYTHDGLVGTILGWGANNYDQLKNGGDYSVLTPLEISEMESVTMLAAGDNFSMILVEDGTLYSWGYNWNGQLGNATSYTAGVPTEVTILDSIINIKAGPSRAFAIREDGSLWAWGANNETHTSFEGILDELRLPYRLPDLEGSHIWEQAEISGSVTDEAGQPIEGALVKATLAEQADYDAQGEFAAITGPDGSYHLSLPPYTYQIVVSMSGYMTEGISTTTFDSGVLETQSFMLRDVDATAVEVPKVAASNSHSLWITGHRVYAAGANWSFQLGHDKLSYAPFFKAVNGLPDAAVSVAAGLDHNLALMSDGTVWAWGSNSEGQLGNGTASNEGTEPFQIPNLNEVKAIAAGEYHSLALKEDGTVWAWGANWELQLGDDTWDNSNVPKQIQGLTQVKAIASGPYHSFALKEDGTVWAWGANWYGQLGIGHTDYVDAPVQLPLTHIVNIAGGYEHSAAVDEQGVLWTWGSNDLSQLGYDTDGEEQLSPQTVSTLSDVQSVSLGMYHSMALMSDGTVWSWGDASYGQTGSYNDGYEIAEPMLIEGIDGIEIATGDFHSFVKQGNGSLLSFGGSWDGQLGSGLVGTDAFPNPKLVQIYGNVTGKVVDEHGTPIAGALVTIASEHDAYSVMTDALGEYSIGLAPPERNDLFVQADGYQTSMVKDLFVEEEGVAVSDITLSTLLIDPEVPDIKELASSYYFNLALMEDGTVWSWGDNWGGQLGTGTTESRKVPQPIFMNNVKQIAAGMDHGMALKEDGTVWVWGSNEYGQAGADFDTSTVLEPIEMTALGDQVASIAASKYASYAVKADGSVWAWGKWNALGDGTGENSYTPVQVVANGQIALTDVESVSTSHETVYATTVTGDVYTWGSNSSGQYGNGTTNSSDYAIVSQPLNGMSNIQGAVGNSRYSVGLKDDGSVWAWGISTDGVFGEGHSSFEYSPIPITGLPNIVDLGAATNYTVAIDDSGQVWTWGEDDFGYHGGHGNKRSAPELMEGLSGIQQATTGSTHVLLKREDGSVWGWGYDLDSQLGIGSHFYVNALIANPVLSGFNDYTTGRLAGIVKNGLGHTISNAEVTVTSDTYSYDAVTNEIGMFVFEDIYPGQYEVIVNSSEGSLSKVVTIEGGLTTTQHFSQSEQTIVDEEAPAITLLGANPVELYVGEVYEEPGYIVEDNHDPEPTVEIIGQVNTQVAGEYTVTYSATDASGNSSAVTRTVIVDEAEIEVQIKEVLFIDIDLRSQYIAGQVIWEVDSEDQITRYTVYLADEDKSLIGSELADIASGNGFYQVNVPSDTVIPDNAEYLVVSAGEGNYVKNFFIELVDTKSAEQLEEAIRKAVDLESDTFNLEAVIKFMDYQADLTGDGLFNGDDVEQLLQYIEFLFDINMNEQL